MLFVAQRRRVFALKFPFLRCQVPLLQGLNGGATLMKRALNFGECFSACYTRGGSFMILWKLPRDFVSRSGRLTFRGNWLAFHLICVGYILETEICC